MTSDQPDARAKGLALALLAVMQFVIILDASIVNVAHGPRPSSFVMRGRRPHGSVRM
jgi:hypothetical protein